jgi:hypothetical protein
MAEAESEIQNINPSFANLLRQERKKAEDKNYIPDCEKLLGIFSKLMGIKISSSMRFMLSSETYIAPEGAANAAKKALKWKEEHGDSVQGGTAVGWTRANQLANKKALSRETVKRMYKFFQRHQKNKAINPEFKGEPWRDAGYVAWCLWGGDAGKSWAEMMWNKFEREEKQARMAKQKGLWDRIREKRERGESPAKPRDEDYPDEKTWKKLSGSSPLRNQPDYREYEMEERIAKEIIRVAKELVSSGPFKVGDLVKYKGNRRVYKVIRVEDRWGTVDLMATSGGPRGSRPSSVDPADLQLADEKVIEILDKQGRTALQAAEEVFRRKQAVVDFYRVIRERYAEVIGFTKGGGVKVQVYHGGQYLPGSQEDFKPDKKNKGEKITFRPSLYRGEWEWSKGNQHIKPYKGGTLTSLLD